MRGRKGFYGGKDIRPDYGHTLKHSIGKIICQLGNQGLTLRWGYLTSPGLLPQSRSHFQFVQRRDWWQAAARIHVCHSLGRPQLRQGKV